MFEHQLEVLADTEPMVQWGHVRKVVGLIVEVEGLRVPVGSMCEIRAVRAEPICAEVVGFREDVALLMAIGDLQGVRRYDEVRCVTTAQRVPVSAALLGRVVDSFGQPVDGGPEVPVEKYYPLYRPAPVAMERKRILEPVSTGVRSVDGFITLGKGQRVGLFSGSGVGKSMLMGMMTRYTSADVTVVALIGERGREVREFIEKSLGKEGLKRSVIVVETSDRPAVCRARCPFAATSIAEHFRDQGKNVLLLMDSITRMANAQREIGLSAGEPPTTKGYPPSVFAWMPRLLERAGQLDRGSITGIYTVLVEQDDMNEPVADHARSILDGHIWLSRELATRGHFPAVDVLGSISRLMIDVVAPEHRRAAERLRTCLAVYRNSEDMINIGAYVKGSNKEIDAAIGMLPHINAFLRQDVADRATFADAASKLLALAKQFDALSGVSQNA